MTTPAPDHPKPLQCVEGTDRCINCGHPVVENYCAGCGQKVTPLRQPVHHFLADAFVEYFGIDGRLWASLKGLSRPGRLTRAYLDGQRVRYLRPLRLYLSATLAFFFLLALVDPTAPIEEGLGDDGVAVDSAATAAARLANVDSLIAAFDNRVAKATQLVDSLARTGAIVVDSIGGDMVSITMDLTEGTKLDGDELSAVRLVRQAEQQRELRRLVWQRNALAGMAPDSVINVYDWMRAAEIVVPGGGVEINLPAWVPRSRAVQRLEAARTREARAAAFGDLVRSTIGRVPTAMFLLLPVFALLLKLIYVRQSWYYSEHLVFALHTHAYAFLAFAVLVLWLALSGVMDEVGWLRSLTTLVSFLLVFSVPAYVLAALRRVYGQGWGKTIAKWFLLMGSYGVVLGLGVVVVFIAAFLID